SRGSVVNQLVVSCLKRASRYRRRPCSYAMARPEEVTISEAVEILGVARRTVQRYIQGQLIRVRNIAPPGSTRKALRLLKEDVVALRTGYNVWQPKKIPKTRPVAGRSTTLRWINMD